MLALKQLQCLRILKTKKLDRRVVKAVLESDGKVLEAVCECAFNLLRGKIRLKECQKQKLNKYKKELRFLLRDQGQMLKKLWSTLNATPRRK